MNNVIKVKDKIYWVGGNDYRITRFENMFPLTHGITYNSYLIIDEKTCLLDTVDRSIGDLFLENIEYLLNGRKLDYLVINHMEPDHCGNIENICAKYPEVKLVGNKKTFQFLEQFYDMDLKDRYYLVSEKDVLDLGDHKLNFLFAPMVHWPEVMIVYEENNKILFSADAFGSFGAIGGSIFSDQVNWEKEFLDEARRYYFCIIGKQGVSVQALFKKLSEKDISMIFPLHGTIFRDKKDVDFIIDKYKKWSIYIPEEKGIVLAYGSMYGNTEIFMIKLASMLAERGVRNIKLYDVASTDASYIVTDLHRYTHAVFGIITYNTELYLGIDHLLREAVTSGYQNRSIELVLNQSWAGKAIMLAQEILSKSKNLNYIDNPFEIRSSFKNDQLDNLNQLVDKIVESYESINLD